MNAIPQPQLAVLLATMFAALGGCHIQSPGGIPIDTRMLGSVTDEINRQQEENADAAKFVIYNHEFELNVPLEYTESSRNREKFTYQAPERIRGFRLTPAGEDHVYQIADTLIQHQLSGSQSWHPWDVVVERSQTSKLWDTQYRYPVHFNAQLDEARRQTVVALLSQLGVENANDLVFVAPAYSEGVDAIEAASGWSSRFFSGNSGSRGSNFGR